MALERPDHLNQTKAWPGELPNYYLYTLGVAGERFFREIKDHARLLGTRCPACSLVYLPPRLFCERCFAKLEEWVEVPPRGRVHTFTVARLDLAGKPLKEPAVLAMVELEGAHGGLVHFLGEVSPDDVKIGMSVVAVFKAKRQRQGAITDIRHFRPL